MKRCAFLSLCERGDFVIDDELAIGPLQGLGWRVSTVSWRQEEEPWERFDAVVIRSTWDYWNDVSGFLEVLSRIDRRTRLANPLSLVHWNLSKTYLRDLEGRGIPIVPTLWPDQFSGDTLPAYRRALSTRELVVKPVLGANGEDAYRIGDADDPVRTERIAERFRGRESMVQRFMPAILSEGEYSLFFFAGELSHAIRKIPAESEFRSQEERGAEIRPASPGTRLVRRGREVMETLSPTPLYARVDLVRTESGDFALMELELIEPSMYLRTDPEAPQRFAGAIDAWFS
jgi:glutathione synthase/RimK-type ligase-like ATP-grasp enzyme